MSLWRQTGEQPEQLANAPALPALAAHVWEYFVQLHNERSAGLMGTAKITARDMRDWCWATGNLLALWERRAIQAVDAAWGRSQTHA